MTDNWINEENTRATRLTKTGKTNNNNAPRLVKDIKKKTPIRSIRSIYIQDSYSKLFDKLVFEQKIIKGKKSPELIEEAIELLIRKYEI
jgi:hypothetical protein